MKIVIMKNIYSSRVFIIKTDVTSNSPINIPQNPNNVFYIKLEKKI